MRSTPLPAALRFAAVCVGVPMVGRGSSEMVLREAPFVVADRRVVLLLDDDDLELAAAGLLELLLLVKLEVAGVGVTDGRPGWLRIC